MVHVWTLCCVCKNVVNEIWEVEARKMVEITSADGKPADDATS